jgi:signal transduction histidine kinase
MDRPGGIRRKIFSVFVLQLAAISCAILLAVYGAGVVLEDRMIRRLLDDEARYALQRMRTQPDTPLPDTYNLRGYRDTGGGADLPAQLRGLAPGFHSLSHEGRDELVYVVQDAPARLVLVFRRDAVHDSALLFGTVLVALVLLIIYSTTWLTYRASRRAVTPVVALARAVRDWDPDAPDLSALDLDRLPGNVDHDATALAGALRTFGQRIEEFVERERNFTRDASHELRSPLTVIKVASDVLADDDQLPPFARRSIGRIRTATRDMEALIEAFLILARESDTGLPEEDFHIDGLVIDEIEFVRPLLDNKPVELVLRRENSFCVHASSRVLSVMIGNLLRNACQFTEQGRVVVTIGRNFVRVEDTGVGISDEDLSKVFTSNLGVDRGPNGGHGVGLTIVKRLSDRFGWPLVLDSMLGKGTTATIRFPHATAVRDGIVPCGDD